MKQRIVQLLKEMSAGLYDKDTECALVLLTAIAGESILLLGPPGIGKSLIARRAKAIFKNAHSFEYLMSRFSTPDEIFGPVSIHKMKDEDIYERNVDGYMPTADVVFLDEIWKAGPAIQNSLLTAINEKIYHNGEKDIHLPMKVLIGASNELPASDEGLEALWDRFIIRMVCDCISKRNEFERMILDDETSTNITIKVPVTEKEYRQWQSEITKVNVPHNILDAINSIREALKVVTILHIDEDGDNEEESRFVYVSDRRWKKIIRLLRTSALMQGRNTVILSDLLLLKYCLWQEMDQIEPVDKIIIRSVFTECTLAILNLRNEIKDFMRMRTEQEAYAKMKIQEPDNNKKIYDHFYYHVQSHHIGNTFIAIADFMNIPSIDLAKRSLGENGIIYQDSVDVQKSYIRLYNPNNRQGSLPKGWRLSKLLRDEDHIYLDGVKYGIEKNDDNKEIEIIGISLEPPKDFYHEIEDICTQIKNTQKELASNLFYNPEDKKNIHDFVEKLNKEIANIRIDVSKT
jgi:MoxR-like ATPase